MQCNFEKEIRECENYRKRLDSEKIIYTCNFRGTLRSIHNYSIILVGSNRKSLSFYDEHGYIKSVHYGSKQKTFREYKRLNYLIRKKEK
jgi:hypothetical protein